MWTAKTSEFCARVVVEHRLDRRVRQDAAVPIELAVDAHGGEGRRQRARGHDVADVERHVAAVEVAHLAGADVGGADRQPGLLAIDPVEVDQLAQASRAAAPCRSSRRRPPRAARAGPGRPSGWAGRRPGCPADMVSMLATSGPNTGMAPNRRCSGPCSTRHQNSSSRSSRSRGLAAGDQAGVDGADRGADHPVGLDAGLVQRLVDADLVGAERAAALEDQHPLAETARHLAVLGRRRDIGSRPESDGGRVAAGPLQLADHRLVRAHVRDHHALRFLSRQGCRADRPEKTAPFCRPGEMRCRCPYDRGRLWPGAPSRRGRQPIAARVAGSRTRTSALWEGEASAPPATAKCTLTPRPVGRMPCWAKACWTAA